MTSPWTEIARRAAEAKGADRVLDADVFELVGGRAWDEAYMRAQEPCGCPHDQAVAIARDRYSPRLTASLDAVVALIEERLPGWGVELNCYPLGVLIEDGWDATLREPGHLPHDCTGEENRAEASTAPLALLSAFALAMAEQTGGET